LAAGLATTTAIIGAVVYGQTSGHKFSLTKIAEGFGTSLASLFNPKNTNAAIYSLLSAGLGFYSLVLLFGSHEVDSQFHLSTAALSDPLYIPLSYVSFSPLPFNIVPANPHCPPPPNPPPSPCNPAAPPSHPPPSPLQLCCTVSVLPMFSSSAAAQVASHLPAH